MPKPVLLRKSISMTEEEVIDYATWYFDREASEEISFTHAYTILLSSVLEGAFDRAGLVPLSVNLLWLKGVR